MDRIRVTVLMLTLVALSKASCLYGQIPFTTVMKELATYYITPDPGKYFGRDFLRRRIYDSANIAGDGAKPVSLDSLSSASFFGSNTASNELLGTTQSIMKLSTSIIYYKLYFYTNFKKNKKLYMPLLFITRLSSRYDSSNVASTTDAVDYDGSPVTVRLMPSRRIQVGDENQLWYGAIIDYRGLNLADAAGNISYEHGFYSSVGLTYGGKGTGQKLVRTGEVTTGVWTVSLMLQCFITNNEVIREMFKTKDNYALSGQLLFNFLAAKNSSLNVRAGAQYFFTEPLNVQKFSIKIGIGISN